ncbi:MAG: RHS repeat-associated core domain-containing protein [Gemmatimonadales bacterium]|nr:RHS repeat-associated core domain-containing protein [Gemmatimonadales bacterium]
MRGLARFRTGAKVKEFTEAPWGDAVADTGLVVRYHFAGREYDGESGLYYMRARYYDPALGRWISEDPIGIAGGLNVYAYAGNDPVNGRDPSGLKLVCTTVELDGYGGGRRECRDVWGPLDWLDPGEQCAMDAFHDPECSGYPDQDVLDYFSGIGGNKGPQGCEILRTPNCAGKSPYRRSLEMAACSATVGPLLLAGTIDAALWSSGAYEARLIAVGAGEAVRAWRGFKVAAGAASWNTTMIATAQRGVAESGMGEISQVSKAQVILAPLSCRNGVSTLMAAGDFGAACGQAWFGR